MTALLDPQVRYSRSSPSYDASTWADHPSENEFGSHDEPLFETANFSGHLRRESIANLVARMKVSELRELAIDVLDNALAAYQDFDYERLRVNIVSWLETAEVTVGTRRRRRSILAAREEGRAQFVSTQSPLAPERRKVRR